MEEAAAMSSLSTPDFMIVDLEPEEVKGLVELERRCFSAPWSEGSFRRALSDPHCFVLTARQGSRIVGYLVAFLSGAELLVANLAVDEEHRRRGIGSRLLEEGFRRAVRQGAQYAVLDVRKSNRVAIRLYQKRGFRILGSRPRYYTCPAEDALVMGRFLDVSETPDAPGTGIAPE